MYVANVVLLNYCPLVQKFLFFSHITGQSKFTRMQKNMHMLLRARTVKREV